MRFSLVLATKGRVDELHRLLNSLREQTCSDLELIVVDQNEDERLTPILDSYRGVFEIRHVQVPPLGKAYANNVGLDLAQGDIVVFPDDDCWYPTRFFSDLDRCMTTHAEWNGMTGRMAASADEPLDRRFARKPGAVTPTNVWGRHISITMCFRTAALHGLRFNESIGVGAGTRWGAGEDTDFLLRFIGRGNLVQYDPSLVVYHPKLSTGACNPGARKKSYLYGMGMGRLLRVYQFSYFVVLLSLVRPLCGTLLMALSCRPNMARYHWSAFNGRLQGWILSGAEKRSLVRSQASSKLDQPPSL